MASENIDFELDDATTESPSGIEPSLHATILRLRQLATPLVDIVKDIIHKLKMFGVIVGISFLIQMLAVLLILLQLFRLVRNRRRTV